MLFHFTVLRPNCALHACQQRLCRWFTCKSGDGSYRDTPQQRKYIGKNDVMATSAYLEVFNKAQVTNHWPALLTTPARA